MNRVRLLSEHVANQIAAGEVVERPASVVKELLENSLDAEATRVEIETAHGGKSLIRVTDDGMGMSRDDALLALERHATSKISQAEDLENIATLGFRGEALPSIAAVSRFTLTTRERSARQSPSAEDSPATQIAVSAGKIREVKEVGAPSGTSIEVRSLFFNLPARRKFLRSDNTENGYIQHITVLHALAHPRVAFRLIQDERELFHLAPSEDLAGRIRELFGAQLGRELLPVNFQSGGLCVRGFVARPGVSRANRSDEYLFVNNRPVDAKTIHYALLEGYHTALMKGRYPVAFVFVELDPTLVDVNVHPTKREVRFHDDQSVRFAVTEAIRAALAESAVKPISSATVGRHADKSSASVPLARSSSQAGMPVPPNPNASGTLALPSSPIPPFSDSPTQPFQLEPSAPATVTPTQSALGLKIPPSSSFIPPPSSLIPISASTSLRLLGSISDLYVLAESDEGLVVIDQHAAHERVLFEQMLRQLGEQPIPSQKLLMPETVELSHRDAAFLRENLDRLRRIGIGIEEFGQHTFLIESLPDFLVCFRQKGVGHLSLQQVFLNIVDELVHAGAELHARRLDESAIATTVCRHAVKARDPLKLAEIENLLRDLAKCDLPYTCPHGRPTMIQISHTELEKKFGRKV